MPPGRRTPRRARNQPVTLAEKEGLALVNGTEGMLGMLLMAVADIRQLLTTADITAALSVEALLGTDQVFLPELHAALRPHPGQAASAANMLRALPTRPSSPRTAIDLTTPCRTRTRCAARRRWPAPSGTCGSRPARSPRGSWPSVIDNPVVLADGRVSSTGNFHGAPLGVRAGLPRDRRRRRQLDRRAPGRPAAGSGPPHGLPAFLAADAGVTRA